MADVYGRFGVGYQPAVAIVHPDGAVETLLGAADEEVLDGLIERAL